MPISDAALDGVGDRQKVKHVKAAIIAGLAGGSGAALGHGYVRYLARRQLEAGAAYLDLNVDDVSSDLSIRIDAMRWLVTAVQDVPGAVLALDSSSPDVLLAGLRATTRVAGAPLLNSAVTRAP